MSMKLKIEREGEGGYILSLLGDEKKEEEENASL